MLPGLSLTLKAHWDKVAEQFAPLQVVSEGLVPNGGLEPDINSPLLTPFWSLNSSFFYFLKISMPIISHDKSKPTEFNVSLVGDPTLVPGFYELSEYGLALRLPNLSEYHDHLLFDPVDADALGIDGDYDGFIRFV